MSKSKDSTKEEHLEFFKVAYETFISVLKNSVQ